MSNKMVDIEALKEFRKRNDARYQKQYPKEFVRINRAGSTDPEVSDKYFITFDAPVTLLAGSFVGKKSKNKYYKASELSRNKKGNCILTGEQGELLQLRAGTYSYAQILKYILENLWFNKIVGEKDLAYSYSMDIAEQKISNQDINFQEIDTYYGGTGNKLFKSLVEDVSTLTAKTFYQSSSQGGGITSEEFDDKFKQKYVDSTARNKYGISLRLRFVKNFKLKGNSVVNAKGWAGQMSNYQMKIMVNFYREERADGLLYIDFTDFYATVQITN